MRTLIRQIKGALLPVLVLTWAGCGPNREAQSLEPVKLVLEMPLTEPASTDAFFNDWPVVQLELTLGASELAALEASPGAGVRATVGEGSRVWTDVGVRMLEQVLEEGSELMDKPSFLLEFGAHKPGQSYHGLEVVELYNGAEDNRYLSEHLAGKLFREAGVPAVRVTHAVVNVNGESKGLYVLSEGVGDLFLKSWFQDASGDLYVVSGEGDVDTALTRARGEGEGAVERLNELVEAAREADFSRRWERLQSVLDVDRFLSFMAVEVFAGHQWGYCLGADRYLLYREPGSGKFVFMPRGFHRLFAMAELPPMPSMAGVVAEALLDVPQGRELYLERFAALQTKLFQVEPRLKEIELLQFRVRPVLEALDPAMIEDYDIGVEALRLDLNRRIHTVEWMVESPGVNPLRFDASRLVTLRAWEPSNDLGSNTVDVVTNASAVSLHLAAGPGGESIASWRTNVVLGAGRYLFEGRVRTRGVVSLQAGHLVGAGLNCSAADRAESTRLFGDTEWTRVSHEFRLDADAGGSEIELICDLVADEGEVWFDLNSLRLRRLSGWASGGG